MERDSMLTRVEELTFLKIMFIYFCVWEGERQGVSRGGAEGDGGTDSEAGSRLRAVSTELDTGLKPIHTARSRPELQSDA